MHSCVSVYAKRLCFLVNKIKPINKFVIHFRHLHLHMHVHTIHMFLCTYWIHCWQPATLLRLTDYMNCDAPCGHFPMAMDGIKRVGRLLALRAPAQRCYCHRRRHRQYRLDDVPLCADDAVGVDAAAARHYSDWRLLCPWYRWAGRHFPLHDIFVTSPPRRAAHRATVCVAWCAVCCR